MNEVSRGIKGKFILSKNDDLLIRELFKGFTIEDVNATYIVMKDLKK